MPAVAGTLVLLFVAGRAFYVSPDSVNYIGTARNLVDGNGFTVPAGSAPVGHFPPLFTLVLAATGKLTGADPLTVARWLNPALFGIGIFLSGWLVLRTTRSLPAAFAASALTLAGFDLLAYHSSALSEPLFVVLTIATLGCVIHHLAADHRRWWAFWCAAGLCAAAVLTRYAGIALVIAAAVALLARGRGRRAHGAVDALVFSAVALTPALVWLAWARQATGRVSERALVFHAFDGSYFVRGAREMSGWIVPHSVSPGWRIAVAAMVLAGLIAVAWSCARPFRVSSSVPVLVMLAFAVCYLAVLVFDRLFVDTTAKLDPRLLLPLHVAAILLGCIAVHRLVVSAGGQSTNLGRGVIAVSVAVVVFQLAEGASWVGESLENHGAARGGFASPAWRESEVIERVRHLPPTTPVYSNAADAIFFLTGREARPVPAHTDYLSGRTNDDYSEEVDAVGDALTAQNAVVVWFPTFTARRQFLPAEQALVSQFDLRPLIREPVAVMYAAAAPG